MDNYARRILNIGLLAIPLLVYSIISLHMVGRLHMLSLFLLLFSSLPFYLIWRIKGKFSQELYENFRRELHTGIMNCSEMLRLRDSAYHSLNRILSDNTEDKDSREHYSEYYMRIISSFKSYSEIVRYISLITPLSLSLILSLIIFVLPPTYYNILNLALFTFSLSLVIAILLANESRRGGHDRLSDIVKHLRNVLDFVKELRELISLKTPLPKALYIECSKFHVKFDPLNASPHGKRDSRYDLLMYITELSQEIGSISRHDLETWLKGVESFISRVYESLSKLYAESRLSLASHFTVFLILGLIVGCMLGVWPVFSQVMYNYNVDSGFLTLSILSASFLVNLIEVFVSDIGLNKLSLLAALLSVTVSVIVSNMILCFFA